MGIVRGIIFFIANITILVVSLRFMSMLLERIGVFRAMNRFINRMFGGRNNDDEN